MGHHDAPEKVLLHKSQGRHPPPPNVKKKRAQVGHKLLVGWSNIVGSFIKFAINFTILQKKNTHFFQNLTNSTNLYQFGQNRQ